jgi:hypothetical protein
MVCDTCACWAPAGNTQDHAANNAAHDAVNTPANDAANKPAVKTFSIR